LIDKWESVNGEVAEALIRQLVTSGLTEEEATSMVTLGYGLPAVGAVMIPNYQSELDRLTQLPPEAKEVIRVEAELEDARVATTEPVRSYGAQDTDSNKPRCPEHRVRMEYDPAEDRMLCPRADCEIQATKRRTMRELVGAPKGDRPAYYRGELAVVIDTEKGEPYLHLKGVNAFVSLKAFIGDDADPKAS
jgi:hypothetical protein